MKCASYILRHLGAAAVVIAEATSVLSCSSSGKSGEDAGDDVLVQIGDSALCLRDVESRIPAGLDPADSAYLFKSIVNTWIEDMLLEKIALQNLDDAETVERLVADYRRKLIVTRYLRKMRNASPEVSDGAVRKYYETHPDEMLLEEPIVKGLYVKVPDSSNRLADIRRWVFSATPSDVDYIEKFGMDDAVQYDYFGDRWISFSSLTDQIPYRFFDPDAFLASTSSFETSYNGYTYLFHINEYKPSGEKMPYEYASEEIRDYLSGRSQAQTEQKMLKSIYSEAMSDGVMRLPGYDPVKGVALESVVRGKSKRGESKK